MTNPDRPTLVWDVDTQRDCMMADGLLYVAGSEQIVPVLGALTDYAHAHHFRIIASADDHVPGHRELSDTPDFRETFPPHCMRGTPGQTRIPETTLRDPLVIEPEPADPAALAGRVRAHDGDILFHKHWFDVFTNPNVRPVIDALDPGHIVLYGVALDVCDRYAIEGLLRHRPATRVHLVTDAVRAIDAAAGEAMLQDWHHRGVALVSSRDVLEGRVV
jgi:nicotinamidase/pyrazinamidase